MPSKQQLERFNQVLESARRMGAQHPEVIAAQWAVESGWGKAPSGKNNLFGIKAGNGNPNNKEKGSVVMTTEKIKGRKVKMLQKFRDYDSIDDSMADRIRFTEVNPRYRKAGYFDAKTPYDAAMSLQRAGYATDDKYANTLNDVMRSAGIDTGRQSSGIDDRPFIDFGNFDDGSAPTPPTLELKFDNDTADAFSAPQLTDTVAPAMELAPWQADIQTIAPDVAQQTADYFNQYAPSQESVQTDPVPTSVAPDYSNQLAETFGVVPQNANQGLGDYLGSLVESIYNEVD